MYQQYLVLGLAGIAGLAGAINIEMTTVGTTTFRNTKYFPTNCQNSKTGQKTNEFWTYVNPTNTDYRYPDYKYYADHNGNLWWEGHPEITVIDNSLGQNEHMQVMLNPNAHSEPAGTLVGALHDTTASKYYPCYVTPAGPQTTIDFFNGWVCYRLYTCSTVPHTVTSVIISKGKTTLSVTESPYENLMNGLVQQLPAADNQISQIPNYEQSFVDMEGNTYSFVAEVVNNGPYNLYWTVQAATQNYQFAPFNPAAGAFDDAYSAGVLYGDASFPQSAAIVTHVGLDHTAYSKINFFQSGFSPAPPPSTGCNTAGFGIGSGATGALGAILGIISVAAAPETGGASLAIGAGIAAGVAGAASGGLGIAASAAC